MAVNPKTPYVGFVLGPNGPAQAPPVVPNYFHSVSPGYTPLRHWESNKYSDKLDDFALAVYYKLVGASAHVPLASVMYFSERGVLADKHSAMHFMLSELLANSDVRHVIELSSLRQFKEYIKKGEEGSRYIVRYKKGVYYITQVNFWPSLVFADIYGIRPPAEEIARLAGYSRLTLGVAIPLTFFLDYDSIPFERTRFKLDSDSDYILDKLERYKLPMWPKYNYPCISTPTSVYPEELIARGEVVYPFVYVSVPDEVIPTFLTVLSADCPVMLKGELALAFTEAMRQRYDLPKYVYDIARVITERCSRLPVEKLVIGAVTHNVISAYVYDPHVTLPLYNAMYWAFKRHADKPVVKAVMDSIKYLAKIREEYGKVGHDAKARVGFLQSLLHVWAPLFQLSMNTTTNYEGGGTYEVFTSVHMLPAFTDRRTGTFFDHADLILVTFNKHNVHPSNPILKLYRDDNVLTFLHKATPEEVIKVATYEYFLSENDAYANNQPPDLEDVDYEVDRLKHLKHKKFVYAEMLWYIVLDDYLQNYDDTVPWELQKGNLMLDRLYVYASNSIPGYLAGVSEIRELFTNPFISDVLNKALGV